jgi:hypothetical protein
MGFIQDHENLAKHEEGRQEVGEQWLDGIALEGRADGESKCKALHIT